MRSRTTLLVCGVVGLVMVAAAGLEGRAQVNGFRWKFHLSPTKTTGKPAKAHEPRTKGLQPLPHGGNTHFGFFQAVLWIVIGLLVLALIVLIVRWLLSRRPVRGRDEFLAAVTSTAETPPRDPAESPEVELPVLRRGVEEALRLLETERVPSDAIIRAWLGLQEPRSSRVSLAASPRRLPSSRRASCGWWRSTTKPRGPCSLYQQVRFGAHPVTSADVETVLGALQRLAATWQERPAGTRPGRTSVKERG